MFGITRTMQVEAFCFGVRILPLLDPGDIFVIQMDPYGRIYVPQLDDDFQAAAANEDRLDIACKRTYMRIV